MNLENKWFGDQDLKFTVELLINVIVNNFLAIKHLMKFQQKLSKLANLKIINYIS